MMHKQYLAHELNAFRRNHCLVLDKRVGKPGYSPGTIPSYFRQRILRHRTEEKSDVNDPAEEQPVVVVDDTCQSDTSDEVVLVDTEDYILPDKSHPEIPDPTKFSVLKQEIEEYCEVQEKIHIVLSMLQARARELEKNESVMPSLQTKDEPPEVDPVDLESLAEKYYQSDDDDDDKKADVKCENNDEDDDVQIIETKPEILFVDADAFDDSAPEALDLKPTSDELIPVKALKDISKTDLFDPTFSVVKLEPLTKTQSVVDSLLNKFNITAPVSIQKEAAQPTYEEQQIIHRLRDRSKIASKPRYVEEEEAPKRVRPSKIFDKIHKKLNLELENTNSNSSTEFYGFDEGEVVKLDKPTVPGLLPTPIVKKSRPNAAFLAHDSSFEDIKIENKDDLFREEGLMSFGSLPPRLECPQRPTDMERPRTVAQKRILLQKKNDVRYLMIDNESKIFHEIEKRSKNTDAELDFDRIQELQDQNIPFTRDTWRALAWLKTEKGKYFFQSLKVDNTLAKLTGCKGSHTTKKLGKRQLSVPPANARKPSCHCPEYPSNVVIDLDAIAPSESGPTIKQEYEEEGEESLASDKKLLCVEKIRPNYSRPGPLSSKLRFDNELLLRTEDNAYLGPLEILELPNVEIEVFPRIDRPLDPSVKPYLKMILPFSRITEKWARFSVSTLKTPDRQDADIPLEERSFCFTLPYVNNQRRILVRRRVVEQGTKKKSQADSLEKLELQLKEPLNFRKHLDCRDGSGPVDPVEKVCADILSEMTNAVAIGLAEDVFIGDDPDGDYSRADKPVNKANSSTDSGKSMENTAKSKRMLREMKRLNATIIETIPESSSEDQKSRCNQQYCAHGCICDVFSGKHTNSNVVRNHCSKEDCMFGCQCGYDKKHTASKDIQSNLSDEGISALTNEDVKYLREKATARLAKEERDFTPTVILTTNSTVVVRNTETETRRHKKKPKKYEDYYNDNSVKNLLNGVLSGENDSVAEQSKSNTSVSKPLPLKERIRHTHVVLNKLQDLDDIEPWCMIHCLYRCYCHGNDTTGKPFKFNEESNIVIPTPVLTAPEPDPLLEQYTPTRRRLYSFERAEDMQEILQPFRKRDSSEESYRPWSERRKKKKKTHDEPRPKCSTEKKECPESSTASSTRTSLEDLLIHDGQTCKRVIPINRNYFKTRNFYRKERYQREVKEAEEKNPDAEKRLKLLLDRCEKSFFEERKRELELLARKAKARKLREQQAKARESFSKSEKERVQAPIHVDIVDSDDIIRKTTLLCPLLDMDKILIFCGRKKYYIEADAVISGKVNLMNLAKKFRTTVYVIRKVKNEPLAKNVTFTYNDETFTLKARKYFHKNQACEQQENEHINLSFSDSESQRRSISAIVQEPAATDNDTQKMMLDQVNSDIVHTMQHIREMLRKDTNSLNPPKKGILYLYKWEKFLRSFNEDLVDLWEVLLPNNTQLIIVTSGESRKSTPSLKGARSIRCARKCNFETKGMSLLTRMVLYQIENPETNKLALVLFGTEHYWRFCGFIKAEKDFLDKGCEVRPTPISHPKLAPKINKYFEAFVASTAKRMVTATVTTAAEVSEPSKSSEEPPAVEVPRPIKEEVSSEPCLRKEPFSVPKMSASFKSNVKLMETKIKDFKNIAIPNVGTRRWFMLNIVNDFSDIYIPSWKSCLTFGRIKQAIALANRYSKTVKLTSIVHKGSQEDILPQIYAAPGQGDCIFLGPYTYTQNIDLMLCQNVDGKMYTREEYERNNHIVRKEQTTGSWLYMKPNTTIVPAPTTSVPSPQELSPTAVHSSLPTFTKIIPPSQTSTSFTVSVDEDCVVIDDDEDILPGVAIKSEGSTSPLNIIKDPIKAESQTENSKNNSQLESLIHQLYNDSDSDEAATTNTLTASSPEAVDKTLSKESLASKNSLSALVDKTIAESKQLQTKQLPSNSAISQRRLSCVPLSNLVSKPAITKITAEHAVPDDNKLKRRSTGDVKQETEASVSKKSRLSLPVNVVPASEVVCLDDEEDESATTLAETLPAPKLKQPSSTTILNSQQAALIASKINLLDPNQKGVAYNPTTGVLRIKRSLMNSITEGSNIDLAPPQSGSKTNATNSALAASQPKAVPTLAKATATSSTSRSPPLSYEEKTTPKLQPMIKIRPPRVPTEGVLRSNISGLGLVPVLWSSSDIVIKVRELSVKHQFVRMLNFDSAIVLLNRFIRKNTYTFKPFSLTIGWKFEPRSIAVLPEENLINTINLRCVVTTHGVIDLYKASAIVAFQHSKPNFYEELLLLRLSILCCKKEQYEEEKCHKYFEKIFVKATHAIKELTSASQALTTQSTFLREQQAKKRARLQSLKGGSRGSERQSMSQTASTRVSVPQSILDSVASKTQAASTASGAKVTTTESKSPTLIVPDTGDQQKESVIIIDDD